jgi:hypothetical protein
MARAQIDGSCGNSPINLHRVSMRSRQYLLAVSVTTVGILWYLVVHLPSQQRRDATLRVQPLPCWNKARRKKGRARSFGS